MSSRTQKLRGERDRLLQELAEQKARIDEYKQKADEARAPPQPSPAAEDESESKPTREEERRIHSEAIEIAATELKTALHKKGEEERKAKQALDRAIKSEAEADELKKLLKEERELLKAHKIKLFNKTAKKEEAIKKHNNLVRKIKVSCGNPQHNVNVCNVPQHQDHFCNVQGTRTCKPSSSRPALSLLRPPWPATPPLVLLPPWRLGALLLHPPPAAATSTSTCPPMP